jgi:hypothetical protein
MTDRPARPWDIFIANSENAPMNDAIADARYNICLGCEDLINLTKMCKHCGCFMKVKTQLPHAECPLKKWAKVVPSITEIGSIEDDGLPKR